MQPTFPTPCRPRLLAVGQGAASTGYSRVISSILEPLSEAWEVHHFAPNYRGPFQSQPWALHPNKIRPDVHGIEQIGPLCEHLYPDVVLLLSDLCFLPLYIRILRGCRPAPKIVAYTPSDQELPPPAMIADIAVADRVVAFTEHGRRTLEEAWRQAPRPAGTQLRLEVIPLGVDTQRFRPMDPIAGRAEPDRRRARRELLGGEAAAADSFLVLNANRNQPRKRIDLTLAGFARFAANKPPHVRLYLHMGVVDQGQDVVALARRYGIADRLVLPRCAPARPQVDDRELNVLYNACDVGLNTALTEGWGLVGFEHGATGAAQVTPDHGVFHELWRGSAQLVESKPSLVHQGQVLERVVTPEGVAAALEALYHDDAHRERMAAAAQANARQPAYAWTTIARRWHRLLQSVLSTHHELPRARRTPPRHDFDSHWVRADRLRCDFQKPSFQMPGEIDNGTT